MRRQFAIGVAWSLVAWCQSAAFAVDVVEYTTGDGKKATVRGVIRSESRTEVVVQAGQDAKTIPVWQIDSVRYDKQPLELATIRSRFEQGKYDEIIEELKELGKRIDEKNAPLQAQLLFYIFRATAERAIADRSQLAEAVKWHERLLENFSHSRFYFPANETAGRLFLATGDYARAAKSYGALKEVDWPGYREKALLFEGVAKLKQGDFVAAIADFDRVAQLPANDSAATLQKNLAGAYKGEALVRLSKFAEAESQLRRCIEATDPEQWDAHAVAHNALGDLLRATKRPKEAILDGYMKVNVLFNRDADQTARALWNLSQLCLEIGQKERAAAFAERLRSDFPNSDWTKRLKSP